MSRLQAYSLVSLLVCGLAAPAVAQDDSPYHRAVTAAIEEYERGNYDEALVLFREAHALQPSARTLRGLGNVCFELRRYVEAVGYYDDALSSTVNPLTAEQRAEVEANLGRARAFVGTLTVSGVPEGGAVLVDGIVFSNGLYTIGEHEVGVTAEGFEPFTARVAIDGGETEELVVVLVPIGGTAANVDPASDGLLVPSIVVMSIGALTLGGFAILGGMALGEQSRIASGCGQSMLCSADDVRTMDDLALGADVLLGIGSAVLAAGVIMLIVDPPHGERPRTGATLAAPWVAQGGGGLVVGGSF